MTIWKAGMLAVCVDDGPRKRSIRKISGQWYMEGGDDLTPLKREAIYRVVAVREKYGVVGLKFRTDATGTDYWLANRFRPAVQDDQRCEEEFITLLKRGAPNKITQPTGGDTRSVPAADCMGTLSHTLHAVGLHSRSQSSDDALGGHSNRNDFVVPHNGGNL